MSNQINYKQSRMQGLINRFIKIFGVFIFIVLIPYLFAYFFKEKRPVFDEVELLILISIPTLITIWLVIFNSGKSKVSECEIELSDSGITFNSYGEIKKILWSELLSLKFGYGFTILVIIRGKDDSKIVFDYFAFSKKQRQQIFKMIREKITVFSQI